jgi:NAD(P)-dependent dehydrogenase (short-subunit alcohol dehydrogenase family)
LRDFKGRVAVVTGAARGIGFAIAARLGREGMKVVLADIDAAVLAGAERELTQRGVAAVAVPVDVSRADEVDRLADATAATFGMPDLVCLNAGVNAAHVPVWDIAIEDWDWILGPNVWGVIHGIRVFVPRMIERGSEGHIAITSSNGALRMRPSSGPYPFTKHVVLSLAESLHHDLAAANARLAVSVLLPGPIRTSEAMARRGQPRHARSDAEQDAERRLMPPDEVAEILLEGIRERRFYVFTHPERSMRQVRERTASMLEDRSPTSDR